MPKWGGKRLGAGRKFSREQKLFEGKEFLEEKITNNIESEIEKASRNLDTFLDANAPVQYEKNHITGEISREVQLRLQLSFELVKIYLKVRYTPKLHEWQQVQQNNYLINLVRRVRTVSNLPQPVAQVSNVSNVINSELVDVSNVNNVRELAIVSHDTNNVSTNVSTNINNPPQRVTFVN